MSKASRQERYKKNRARREAISDRKRVADRHRRGLTDSEEEYPLAAYLRRIIGLTIDQIVMYLLYIFWLFLLTYVVSGKVPFVLEYVPQLLYAGIYVIPVVSRRGRTFGGKIARIEIINAEGKRYLTLWESFVRWFGSFGFPLVVTLVWGIFDTDIPLFLNFINILGGVILLAPAFFTKRRQGFHDLMANSIVIQTPRRRLGLLTTVMMRRHGHI